MINNINTIIDIFLISIIDNVIKIEGSDIIDIPSNSLDSIIIYLEVGSYNTNLIERNKEDETLTRNEIHNISYLPSNNQLIKLKSKNSRIVATLTSNYINLKYIRKTLLSLHDQNFDKIYLVVPSFFFGNSKELIPEWIKICCDVVFYNLGHPIINILGILDLETDNDTIIVSVENGVIYPKSMAKFMRNMQQKTNKSAFCPFIYKFKSINFFEQIVINNNIGDCFEGIYGVSYRRDFFKNDFLVYYNHFKNYEYFVNSPYLLIINYLHKYKINIRCIIKQNYNHNLVNIIIKKTSLYNSAGLNYKIIIDYYKVLQLLYNNSFLYLRNYRSILEYLKYLSKKPYNIPFCL